jgi:hypothetical protein
MPSTRAPSSLVPWYHRGSRLRLRGGRAWSLALVLLCAGLVLPGCPVFPENGCLSDGDCAQGFACEARTGLCVPSERPARVCSAPSHCGFNETCSLRGICVPGDCTFSGCVAGYTCDRDSGVWQCIASSSGVGGAGGGGGGMSGSSSGLAGHAGGGG